MTLDQMHDQACRLQQAGAAGDAQVMLRSVLAAQPGRASTRHALGISLLSQGRYSEGFAAYAARHEVLDLHNPKPALPFPEWQGEEVHGKVVTIWPEQGLGDQIMHARFAKVLSERGANVTLICRPPLVTLFQTCLPLAVVAASGAVDFPDPDYWVMTCSLPWRLGVTPETIPSEPYLSAPPTGRGARIGVVTRGNHGHANDAHRSLPKEQAARLLSLPGAMSLHPEDTGAADFLETARIIAGLDLVIAVDTSVAHLAGAMGKPCWILLPGHSTDWRWMRDRRDTPWYPSAQLFREVNGWPRVLDEVETELRKAAGR